MAFACATAFSATLESRVKAALIFNFAKFIEWPEASFSSGSSPIVVCVMGAENFGSVLTQTLQRKTAQGRPFLVRSLNDTEPVTGCKILFIGSSENGEARQVLSLVRRQSVVTVSDMPGFEKIGGMIRLFTFENKVRFAINLNALNVANLHVSSQLLKLSQLASES